MYLNSKLQLGSINLGGRNHMWSITQSSNLEVNRIGSLGKLQLKLKLKVMNLKLWKCKYSLFSSLIFVSLFYISITFFKSYYVIVDIYQLVIGHQFVELQLLNHLKTPMKGMSCASLKLLHNPCFPLLLSLPQNISILRGRGFSAR